MNLEFRGYPCAMRFARYRSTQNIAVQLVVNNPDGTFEQAMHGEPMCMATTNLTALPDGQIAIKNWSENDGIVNSLVKAGLIEPEACGQIENDFVSAPVHKLTPGAIVELRVAGVVS